MTFRYTDAKTGQTKFCTLPAEQFIHRFLQHVLPRGFVKVRYYGLFSPGSRKRLARLQGQLAQSPSTLTPDPLQSPAPVSAPTLPESSEADAARCPVCGGVLRFRTILRPAARWAKPP